MSHRELLLYWSTAGLEIILCIFVYVRKLQRYLPIFTAYATLLATDTLGIQIVYHHFGFRSPESRSAYWMITGVNVVACGFAIAELCRHELRAYRGIWKLAWRGLALLAVIFLGNAVVDAWGQPNRIAIYGLTIERDFGVASTVILLVMLLIRKYYGLGLESLQKTIAIGMFVFCVVDTVSNTMLRDLFTSYIFVWSEHESQIGRARDLWNVIHTSAFVISVSIWCFALRKPLPAPERDPVLLPLEVYGELSSALNLRLRAFNDRLLELLRS
jgi:hypothetical protein